MKKNPETGLAENRHEKRAFPSLPRTERGLIAAIAGKAGGGGDVIKGIGDDCAVFSIAESHLVLVTMDTLVEGVHFDLSWHPPELLGRKAAAVNLSDIAAMGGTPRHAFLSLAFPPRYFDLTGPLTDGLLHRLGRHNVRLLGGDTVRARQCLVITVTLIGDIAEGKAVFRDGARQGDIIYVSGHLGQSAAGLELCKNNKGIKDPKWRELIQAHLDPTPQMELGQILAASGLVSAMMDLSDGVATDLAHLAEASGVGAFVEKKDVPLSNLLIEAASMLGRDPMEWALTGGEDYHLLFTVPELSRHAVESLARAEWGKPVFPIGRIVPGGGVRLIDKGGEREIGFQGYDHFPGGE